jgi:hypothetical protein
MTEGSAAHQSGRQLDLRKVDVSRYLSNHRLHLSLFVLSVPFSFLVRRIVSVLVSC